jgi:hypothetical protein
VGVYYETETEGAECSAGCVQMLKDLGYDLIEGFLLVKRSTATEAAHGKILVWLVLTYRDCDVALGQRPTMDIAKANDSVSITLRNMFLQSNSIRYHNGIASLH